MLRKLNVAVPPPAPSLATSVSLSAATETAATPAVEAPRSALAKVCTVENLLVRGKAKQPKGAPSLYEIELFFTQPGRPSAMLAPTWKIGADMGAREPDARRHKPFNEAFECHDAVAAVVKKCAFGRTKCRLCQTLHSYIDDNYTAPHQLNRALIGTKRKCLLLEETLAKIIYLVVRAQRPARPTVPYEPNCENQTQIAEIVATFLEL